MKQKVMGIVDHLPEDKLKKLDHFIKHDLSTDEGSDHSLDEGSHYKIKEAGELQKICESYYKPIDKYDNCELSIAIEQKKFQMIKDVFGLKDCSDAELLKTIAFDVTNFSNIGHSIAVSILGAVVDQLDVMGEDTGDISYI